MTKKEKKKTIKQATFNSVTEASERWIREGKAYKDAINAWLDVIYLEKRKQEDPEPTETRKDMAAYVLDQIVAFNEKGEHEKLRKLFPPDFDPFVDEFEKEFTHCVYKVMLLPDDRIVCLSGDWNNKQSYIINNDKIEELPELISFGASHDKKYIAKACKNSIEITEGWDGAVVCSVNYPNNYGEYFSEKFPDVQLNKDAFTGAGLQIESINVFNNGKRVLLTSSRGIFVLGENNSQLIHPNIKDKEEWLGYEDKEEMVNETESGFNLSYPNADLSPDDKYISLGSQDSGHIILTEKDAEWTETGWIEPRSSYPHCTKFNYLIKDKEGNPYPHVALSSCHFGGSATIGLPLKNLTENFEASGYDADETLDYIDESNWIYSILPSALGYFLGANNGYIWFKYYRGIHQLGYIHIGGTIMSMDLSGDRKTLIVATYSGQIVQLKWESEGEIDFKDNNRKKDTFLITDLPLVDKKRYLFWKGKKPMIW